MAREIFLTVGTGRDRRDIAEALAKSIRHHRPDRTWLLTSIKTEQETVPVLLEVLGKTASQIDTRVFEDPDDAEVCCRESRRWIEARIAAGVGPDEIVVDYTSGTKAMSVGLFAAAVGLGVETISYVTGRRDDTGRVIPGGERFSSFTPRMIYAQRDLDRAAWLFDRYRFEEAASLAADAASCGDPEISARAQVAARLAEAFGAWDRFDHGTAFLRLDSLGDDVRLDLWSVRPAVERAKQLLYRAKSERYCGERLADLAANARRRLEEGKYDDAVGRCYRAFEYLAQLGQHNLGLDPADLRWDAVALKLPGSLQEPWRERADPKGRLRLGLRNDYELLRDLGEGLGARLFPMLIDRKSTLYACLERRNNSILAHGTDPVDKQPAEGLLTLLEECAQVEIPQWARLVAMTTFPRLVSAAARP
jgi:CRISPR-associated protein (TIGR02710 family)